MGSPLRAAARLFASLLLTAVLLPVQIAAVQLGLKLATYLPVFYHRICSRLLGFRIRIHGHVVRKAPVLYVCNHCSYADISLIGAVLPVSFVAKAEIADWPLFGLLAKLQRSIFIDRQVAKAAADVKEMTRRLENGDNLVLFPEGTSSNGNVVLPFRSALFGVAQIRPSGNPLCIQPVSLAYTRLDGMPIGRALRPYFAWYGDMELPIHLWEVAGLGRVTVDMVFHKPVTIEDFGSRKQLAEYCHKVVSTGVSAANAGRIENIVGELAATVA